MNFSLGQTTVRNKQVFVLSGFPLETIMYTLYMIWQQHTLGLVSTMYTKLASGVVSKMAWMSISSSWHRELNPERG